MEELLKFLMDLNLSVVIKASEYIYLEGHIRETNKYITKIMTASEEHEHIIDNNTIKGIGLANSEVSPGPCIFDKLPIKYPPYCWTCTKNPNPLILELIQLTKTLPPDMYISFSLNAFEQIMVQIKNIYEINNTFVFVCLPVSTAPDIFVPIALVCSKIDNIDIDSDMDGE